MTELDDVARYAAAVRRALADVPDDEREALLEDLESHLDEVAAESGAHLAERLGDPEQYASELRAAYGAGARQRRRRLVPRRLVPRRRWAVGLAAALVVLAAVGAWLAWRSMRPAPAGPQWSQAQLLSAARGGEVRTVDITGSEAIATGRDGRQHDVHLPADTDALAGELSRASVDVTYEQGSVNFFWPILLITVGYLLVGLLVLGSIVAAGVYFLRQILVGRPS